MMCGDVYLARLPPILGVVAKPAACLRFSRGARPSSRDEFLDASLEVKAELVIHFARHARVRRRKPEHAAEQRPTRTWLLHQPAVSGVSTRDTARVYRSQRESSALR